MTTSQPTDTNNTTTTLPPLTSFDLTPIELSLQQCTSLLQSIDQQTQLLQQWQQQQTKCNEVLSLIAQLHVWQQQLSQQPCIAVKLHAVHSMPSLSSSGLPHCSISVDVQNTHSKLMLPLANGVCSIVATLSTPTPVNAAAKDNQDERSTLSTLTHHVQLSPPTHQLMPNETLHLDIPLPEELVGRLQHPDAKPSIELVTQYCISLRQPTIGKVLHADELTLLQSAEPVTAPPLHVLHLPLGGLQLSPTDVKLLQVSDGSSAVGSKQWYQQLVQGLRSNNTSVKV